MKVVHQGKDDKLAQALERAFAMADNYGPVRRPPARPMGLLNALASPDQAVPPNGLLNALAASPAPRAAPRGLLDVVVQAAGTAPQEGELSRALAPPSQRPLSRLDALRLQYPQYASVSDEKLSDALHARYYRDMPREQFDEATKAPAPETGPWTKYQQEKLTPAFEVEAPDGSIIEFPAGTSEETARAAMARHYPPSNDANGKMQRYEVQGPDGRTFEIEAPNQAAALQDFEQQQGRAQGAGPWKAYRDKAEATRLATGAKDPQERDRQPTARWQDAPIVDQEPQQQAPAQPQQIVGGVIMPPAPDANGQWAGARPAQRGLMDYVRQGSDAVGDAALAGAAGASRGVTGLMDLPGMVTGGVGSLAASGLERTGIVSPGVAQGMRDSFNMMPMGDGDNFRDDASTVTGGGSEYRGANALSQYAGTAGEFLPSALLAGGPTVGNALRYGVLPGLASEGAGQAFEGNRYEPWVRAAAAIAAAPAVNALEKGARWAISPNAGADAGRLALAQVLDDAGVPISAGQRVGSETLRRKEGMSQAGQALNETQREALTRAALRTAGTDASRATPEVLEQTARRIGSVFDDVARGVDVTPDPQTLNALSMANETYKQLAPKSAQAPIVGEIVQRMTGAFRTGQSIPARTLNSWRSNLSRLTTSSDGATRSAAGEALTALDDAMTATLTGLGRTDDVARLATAREQWRNFLAIQQAATGAGEAAAAGILSPSALRNAVVQQGRASYAQGRRGDLGDLARAAEGVIKPLPTSGTAENLRALGIPSALWSAAGAAGGFKMTGGPTGGLLGALAAAAVPNAAAAARMSGPVQGWLANQAVSPFGAMLPRNALAPVPSALSTINKR